MRGEQPNRSPLGQVAVRRTDGRGAYLDDLPRVPAPSVNAFGAAASSKRGGF